MFRISSRKPAGVCDKFTRPRDAPTEVAQNPTFQALRKITSGIAVDLEEAWMDRVGWPTHAAAAHFMQWRFIDSYSRRNQSRLRARLIRCQCSRLEFGIQSNAVPAPFFMTCLVLIIFGAVQCAKADTILNTIDVWNGSTSLCCFGSEQDAGTAGQTITVPATDSILTSFTLEIEGSASNLPFYMYVAKWNGDMITGPILYRSPLQSTSTPETFIAYTFAPNLSLISGEMYILFAADAETDYAAHPGLLAIGYLGTDIFHGENAYSGGSERFLPKGLPVSWWSTTPWLDSTDFGDTSADNDLAFSATFSSVPEPSSISEAILGIVILVLTHAMKK